jgi:hypothetical protein
LLVLLLARFRHTFTVLFCGNTQAGSRQFDYPSFYFGKPVVADQRLTRVRTTDRNTVVLSELWLGLVGRLSK